MLKAKLTQRVASSLGSRVFLRVNTYRKEEEFFAEPVRVKGSGILTTMTKANGYVVIPENREGIEEGESVTIHLFNTSTVDGYAVKSEDTFGAEENRPVAMNTCGRVSVGESPTIVIKKGFVSEISKGAKPFLI